MESFLGHWKHCGLYSKCAEKSLSRQFTECDFCFKKTSWLQCLDRVTTRPGLCRTVLVYAYCPGLFHKTWDHPKQGQYGGKDKAERQSEAILIIPVRNDSAIELLIAVEVVRNVCFGLCFQSRSSAISKHSERERGVCVCVCVCVCEI